MTPFCLLFTHLVAFSKQKLYQNKGHL
uniref:Uncharacterized protein n=1 Tax=Lepeophtheirus salmonis TaxID=72036 RepID=A0A0K2VJN8_LEPSM